MIRLLDRLPGVQGEIVESLTRVGREQRRTIWLVGGPVRDLVIHRPVRDLDFVCEEGAEAVAAAAARALGGTLHAYERFLTFRIVTGSGGIDITTARREHYRSPGALPIVEPATIVDDLKRRDFSINAMAVRLDDGTLLDVTRGLEDLEAKSIRVLHDRSFLDDPTRILRAIRLATRLDFVLDHETAGFLTDALARDALTMISSDRLWREILAAIREEDPLRAIAALAAQGCLRHEGLAIDIPILDRLRVARDAASARPEADRSILFLGALAAAAPRVIDHAPLSAFDRKRVLAIEGRAGQAARALASDQPIASRVASGRGMDIETLALAEAIEPAARDVVSAVLASRALRLPFRGGELGVPPGPHIGRALADTREAIVTREVAAASAIDFARQRALSYLRHER